MQTRSPQVIHLRCPAPLAFDFASLAEEYGRACAQSLQQGLGRDGGSRTQTLTDTSPRHLAVVAAHFARRALGER